MSIILIDASIILFHYFIPQADFRARGIILSSFQTIQNYKEARFFNKIMEIALFTIPETFPTSLGSLRLENGGGALFNNTHTTSQFCPLY